MNKLLFVVAAAVGLFVSISLSVVAPAQSCPSGYSACRIGDGYVCCERGLGWLCTANRRCYSSH